jgi:hypothetical protein
VINGNWGNGEDRKRALTNAGLWLCSSSSNSKCKTWS